MHHTTHTRSTQPGVVLNVPPAAQHDWTAYAVRVSPVGSLVSVSLEIHPLAFRRADQSFSTTQRNVSLRGSIQSANNWAHSTLVDNVERCLGCTPSDFRAVSRTRKRQHCVGLTHLYRGGRARPGPPAGHRTSSYRNDEHTGQHEFSSLNAVLVRCPGQ